MNVIVTRMLKTWDHHNEKNNDIYNRGGTDHVVPRVPMMRQVLGTFSLVRGALWGYCHSQFTKEDLKVQSR